MNERNTSIDETKNTKDVLEDTYDVCVVGGGSGGFGAAVAAARLGARVLLVEAGRGLGGTSTWAGVNNYEPVAGATGLPEEVYHRLREIPNAVALQCRRESHRPEWFWGGFDCVPETDYHLSLSRRGGTPITFEPEILNQVMLDMVASSGATLLLQTRFKSLNRQNGHIQSIVVEGSNGNAVVQADIFIDSTAGIYLAQAAGCQMAIGPESPSVYEEPSAPEKPDLVLNNASLCYRITPLKKDEPSQIQSLPTDVDLNKVQPVTSIRTYPHGDLNMNPIHMMTGKEAYELGEKAHEIAQKRILAHWHILQTRYGAQNESPFSFDRWRIVWVSPMLGVRETHRLVGQYVLREQDLDSGLRGQVHDDVIALADHSIDFHGARPSRELPGPYGIPFRCLLPIEVDNLLVACRGASFSSIGASSSRLSRTMMVLGQAAGTAVALFGTDVHRFDSEVLKSQLRKDGVALDLKTGYLDAMDDIVPIAKPRW